MSATLRPLPYFADVLGFRALQPAMVSAPSPFPRGHRRVVVAANVSTTYRERARDYPAVAELVERIVALRAGRYIAFFPSFAYLAAVQRHLTLPADQLLVQRPAMPELDRARLLAALRGDAGPRLLLAVTGGVFAEGVDLPGEALIGAIVVGPALPPVGFERERMRRYFDGDERRGFAYAMLYPGMQRVIQAAGRVIRTMDDRGVIALIGRRFAQPDYAACMPPEWLDHGPAELTVADPIAELAAFWATVEPSFGEPRAAERVPGAGPS